MLTYICWHTTFNVLTVSGVLFLILFILKMLLLAIFSILFLIKLRLFSFRFFNVFLSRKYVYSLCIRKCKNLFDQDEYDRNYPILRQCSYIVYSVYLWYVLFQIYLFPKTRNFSGLWFRDNIRRSTYWLFQSFKDTLLWCVCLFGCFSEFFAKDDVSDHTVNVVQKLEAVFSCRNDNCAGLCSIIYFSHTMIDVALSMHTPSLKNNTLVKTPMTSS